MQTAVFDENLNGLYSLIICIYYHIWILQKESFVLDYSDFYSSDWLIDTLVEAQAKPYQ